MPKEKSRLLIIGSRGFLGSYTAGLASDEFSVIEGNRALSGRSAELSIDIADEASVKAAFAQAKPEFVLLLAAISDIDRCEQFPEQANAVNFRGAEHVAEACARGSARLLFTSTGAVFDGLHHGYTEQTPVSPASVYGQSKASAEASITRLLPSAIVVRIALAVGFAAPPNANALLDTLKKRWGAGESIAFPVFEQRNPIDAPTCSRFMLDLLRNPAARGIFHIGSQDPITRYELGLKLAHRMGYSDCVRPQLEQVPGRAPRGPNHHLLTDKLAAISAIPIPTCDQVIERCFDGSA